MPTPSGSSFYANKRSGAQSRIFFFRKKFRDPALARLPAQSGLPFLQNATGILHPLETLDFWDILVVMKSIIVYGGGATGKSTLARYLAKSHKTTVFIKDEYKESQFDFLGHKPSINEFRKIEADSWQKTALAIKQSISKDSDLIVEGNFMLPQKRLFQSLLTKDTAVVELYCYTRGFRILRRYVSRNGKRHPSHRDELWYGLVFLESLATALGLKPYRPFKYPNSAFLQINTNDFSKIDYQQILDFIKNA